MNLFPLFFFSSCKEENKLTRSTMTSISLMLYLYMDKLFNRTEQIRRIHRKWCLVELSMHYQTAKNKTKPGRTELDTKYIRNQKYIQTKEKYCLAP